MEQSAELKNLMLRFYDAISHADLAFFDRGLARHDGVLAIGTDPNEWWLGYDKIMSLYKTQLKEMGGMTVIAGNPQAYCDGAVGWGADRPRFKMPDGKTIPFRLTVVFHREAGEWKIIQHHASIGVANEQAIGMSLTV